MSEPLPTLPLFPDLDSESTSSLPAGHARGTAWLESVVEWLMAKADSGAKSSVFWPSNVPAGFLAKTSLEFCPSTGGVIGLPSSGTWKNSGFGMPGACLTLNFLEFRNDGVACSLSQILETGHIPEKYYLSGKAALGILRRAEKRGRALPEALRLALIAVATMEDSEPNRENT